MNTQSLSGWSRAWIVLTTLSWAFAAWHVLTTVGLPPPQSPSDSEICRYAWRQDDYRPDSVWLRSCESDPEFLEIARSIHAGGVSSYPVKVVIAALPGLLLPFAVAAIWLVGRWVQRGFRQH